MWKLSGLLLAAAVLSACATQQAEEPSVPTRFAPEMERMADDVGNVWQICLRQSFPNHVRRGLDPEGAAEAALSSCTAEERALIAIGIQAGIPAETVHGSMQLLRVREKQRLLLAYQQAVADVAARQRQARRPAGRSAPAAPAASGPVRQLN